MSKKTKNYFIILPLTIFFIANIIIVSFSGIDYPNNLYQFQTIPEIFTTEMFICLIALFSLGSLVGWHFIFSIIKQPSSFKQKLADCYIIFLVSILNHTTIPKRFIIFTSYLGLFLARKSEWVWSFSTPIFCLILFGCSMLTFFISFILVYGFFVLSLRFPGVFGRFLINFLEKNANKDMLKIIGLEKRPRFSKKASKTVSKIR